MLELVVVFRRGGLVLWSRRLSDSGDALVQELVRDVLLNDRSGGGGGGSGSDRFERGPFSVRWTHDNSRQIVIAAVFLNVSAMNYVPQLIDRLKAKFVAVTDPDDDHVDFDEAFDRVLEKFECGDAGDHAPARSTKQTTTKTTTTTTKDKEDEDEQVHVEGDGVHDGAESESEAAEEEEAVQEAAAAMDRSTILARLKARGGGGRRGGGRGGRGRGRGGAKKAAAEPSKKVKKARKWGAAVDAAAAKALDRSGGCDDAAEATANVQQVEIRHYDSEYDTSSQDEEDDRGGSAAGAGGVFGFFQGIVGKELGREDLEPVLEAMRQSLLCKNVAMDIAGEICESVLQSLVGKSMSSLQIKSTVHKTMAETLTRILSTGGDIDLLRGVAAAQAEKRPYTVVFVGVNGVGKSTSLSKVAYYLMTKRLKVGLAACDTFRAGAVEQLRTHAVALGVDVFHKGYNKDPSAVALDATVHARKKGYDALLIDTAGRMQDNEPLMRSLAKLIAQNRPDLVLFVGEALVGNDGVDQLTKFNEALANLSTEAAPRLIDGIVLTKFDTIDDKVGAAISMTFTSGVPILFVGVGQDYADLRRMNVPALIKKLLK